MELVRRLTALVVRVIVGSTVFGVFGGLAVVAMAALPASAHTLVRDAAPGPGESVSAGVEVVELEFLDPVMAKTSILVTLDGVPVKGLGRVEHPSPTTARVAFEPLSRPGRYTVEYMFASLDGALQREAHQFEVVADEPVAPDSGRRTVAVALLGLAVGAGVVLRITRSTTRVVETVPTVTADRAK